ncbi:MAG TPA: hypothetical protein VFY36_11675 [Solirubrobacteraceae bacterium]|nr:hypothetical protein [Solirubrobacteraceae bacterium]
MYTPIFAHLGHWYVSLPIFGAPVAIVAIAVKVSERRERRRARDGDTSRLRVVSAEDGDRTIVTVNGPLDYPTLLDIEHELGVEVRRAPRVLLDMSHVTAVEKEEFAWSVTEIVNGVAGADIAVAIGSAPALRALGEVCALEGIKLVGGPARSARP